MIYYKNKNNTTRGRNEGRNGIIITRIRSIIFYY